MSEPNDSIKLSGGEQIAMERLAALEKSLEALLDRTASSAEDACFHLRAIQGVILRSAAVRSAVVEDEDYMPRASLS